MLICCLSNNWANH